MLYDILNKGGYVMYPLLVCSVISLTIVFERIVFWINASRRRDQNRVNSILSLAEQGKFDEAEKAALDSKDYIARILQCGIAHRKFSLSAALEMASEDALVMMKRYLGILDTIITLAPLLGIFGTVTGIILSFKFFGPSGVVDPQTVTSGIAQALITTAAGLGVAILTLIPYNYFLSKIDTAVSHIEKYATSLEIVFNKHSGDNGNEAEKGAGTESTG